MLGSDIPREVHPDFPGDKAPFTAISDLFFEKVKTALLFGPRGGGKTFNVTSLDQANFEFKRGCKITHAGATKDQAAVSQEYFSEFYLTNPLFFDRLKSDPSKQEVKHRNGSKFKLLTGTEKGLRSAHPHKSDIDEIDEIPWTTLQTGFAMSMSSRDGSILGQDILSSTRQKANGSMNRLLTEANKRNVVVYRWNIFTVLETCDRKCFGDKVHGDCPIYWRCEGKAHNSKGFFKISDFIEKIMLIDDMKFRAEYLNEFPEGDILVYGDVWNPDVHIIPKHKEFEIPSDWTIIGGIDFGGAPGHPFVYLKLALSPDGYWFVFFEYVNETGLFKNHSEKIMLSPLWKPGEIVFADHDAQGRKELNSLGIPTTRAKKDVIPGIDAVRGLLQIMNGRSRLYIFESCYHTIDEFLKYSWPKTPDGKPFYDKPIKLDDHCMDAIRYVIYSYLSGVLPRYTTGYVTI